jgi:hypothetical protein
MPSIKTPISGGRGTTPRGFAERSGDGWAGIFINSLLAEPFGKVIRLSTGPAWDMPRKWLSAARINRMSAVNEELTLFAASVI